MTRPERPNRRRALDRPPRDRGERWETADDDGLSRERTLLSWDRTALSFAGFGLVAAKGFQNTRVEPLGYALGAAAAILGGVIRVMGGFRFEHRFWYKRVGRARDRSFRTVGMGTTALATATIVLLLFE